MLRFPVILRIEWELFILFVWSTFVVVPCHSQVHSYAEGKGGMRGAVAASASLRSPVTVAFHTSDLRYSSGGMMAQQKSWRTNHQLWNQWGPDAWPWRRLRCPRLFCPISVLLCFLLWYFSYKIMVWYFSCSKFSAE